MKKIFFALLFSFPFTHATAVDPINYSYIDDGRCNPNNKCVAKEQFAAICKKTSSWDPVIFGAIAQVDNDIAALYQNTCTISFSDISVYVEKQSGQCKFMFNAIGMIKGMSYSRSYSCDVWNIFDDGKRKKNSLKVSHLDIVGCRKF